MKPSKPTPIRKPRARSKAGRKKAVPEATRKAVREFLRADGMRYLARVRKIYESQVLGALRWGTDRPIR